MIEFTIGDIFLTDAAFIGHGVATGSQEGLGTGLALEISRRWPDVQKSFKRYTRVHAFGGGDIYAVNPHEDRPGVIYIATQPDMYHATMKYLNRGLRNLASYCVEQSVDTVALPKIGAGLGKLDWASQVKPLMKKRLVDLRTRFIVYEHYIRADT